MKLTESDILFVIIDNLYVSYTAVRFRDVGVAEFVSKMS